MPIEELSNEVVTQRCAVCQTSATVLLSTLTVGVGSAVVDDIDARALRLPACTNCKAVEFLIRSTDGQPSPPAGSYAHLHGLLVDQLHAQLAGAGRVEARLHDLKVPELSAVVLKELFPAGLKLAAPGTEKLQP